jgi:hypothetical protein
MENSIRGPLRIMLYYEAVWLKIGLTGQKLENYPTLNFKVICQTNHGAHRKYYL